MNTCRRLLDPHRKPRFIDHLIARNDDFGLVRPPTLPQRVFLKYKTTVRVVSGCRIRTASLRKGELLHPPSMQQPREAKVSFDAARLVIKSVLLVALPGELLLNGPGLSPHGRIFDGHDVFKRSRPGPRPALDQMQVLP